MQLLALICSLLAGLAFAFSLPPYNQEYLGWIALAPLLWAACGKRPIAAAGLGLLAGSVSAVTLARWHPDTTRLIWAYVPFLWVALLFAVVAMTASILRESLAPGRWALGVACAGMTLEWLTSWLPMPVHIALTQYQNLPLIQMASITGIWGVSFLVWLVNAAFADALLQRQIAPASLRWAIGLAAFSWLTGLTVGLRDERRPLIAVAAIQDFADPSRRTAQKPLDRPELTEAATGGASPARLVVWSEECLRKSFNPADPDDPTRTLAQTRHIVLVAGYMDDAKPRPHNCSAVIDADGIVAGVFQKMPLYLSETLTNVPGAARPAVKTAIGSVGSEICFDSFYTGITRGLAASGARIVAMPNYDPPTPFGTLHYLHAAMLPFRAVENGVPFVRSDPNGLSQVIDGHGRVLAQGPLYRSAVVSATVALGNGRGTFFTRTGDWLAWLCVAAFPLICISSSLPRKPSSTIS
jgi:apolipoprotein N-acyltransferase